ncbi:MAG: endopeptidase La [Candidatus Dependentiae bacterium]|nr:endopeptidase La [Candidatus Dependentiae bacterium]
MVQQAKDIPNKQETWRVVREFPVLPLKDTVLLPRSIMPLVVGRMRSIQAVEAALNNGRELCVVAQRDASIDNPGPLDLHSVGTRATILQVMPIAKGNFKVLVEGIARVRLDPTAVIDSYIRANCYDLISHTTGKEVEVEALWRQLRESYKAYIDASGQLTSSALVGLENMRDISDAVDSMIMHSGLGFADRQKLLETPELDQRLSLLYSTLEREREIIKTQASIRDAVQGQLEKNQREYYLSEQLKAINKELGRDEQFDDVTELRKQVKKAKLPDAAMQKCERELHRLEQMPPFTAEAVVSKNYIDWLIALPWHAQSQDTIDMQGASEILERDHFGLKKVKERILEFVAAKKFKPDFSRSPIICLVGPPGVGKTSLARSIAASLGREFLRVSLGGTRDDAEIRGHRRTYVGSLPGKIIQAMATIKTTNPVILLDEIDKLAHDSHGDPASALLEVLDPEQNSKFVDNFLEVGYDLSHVMFVTTANSTEGIPYPLFDRMEIIYLSGYTYVEKLQIAEKFLLPKLFREHGVLPSRCSIPSSVIELIIEEYTHEAGVRQLERILAKLTRKVIQELLKKNTPAPAGRATPKKRGRPAKFVVTADLSRLWLGAPVFKRRPIVEGTRIGRATGLAWTELGGDILEIETAIVPGKGELTLTGQLGDVMRESAQAALSYVRSQSSKLGLKKNFFASHDIHVHVPEGATPKDGPSAGITICTALVSALTNTPVRSDIAMTGEITLRGRVLAIGGLKEKLLAAHQYAVKTVLLPTENREEFGFIRDELQTAPAINFVHSIDEVFKHAFHKSPFVA